MRTPDYTRAKQTATALLARQDLKGRTTDVRTFKFDRPIYFLPVQQYCRCINMTYDDAKATGLSDGCIIGDRKYRIYTVIYNESDKPRMMFTLAHEIGHDRLHRSIAENGGLKESSFFDMKSKPEMEANIFAANLLITDKEVIGYGEDGFTAEEMAKDLFVPYPLALIKINDMIKRGYELNIPYVPKAEFLGTI